MREIKFRVWDGELMHIVAELVFDMGPKLDGKGIRFYGPGVGQGRINGKNIVLMQYTGLKDKNGKEIYEGDIVRYLSGDERINHLVVKWSTIDAAFLFGWVRTDLASNNGEVIGNIYENQELLEG